MGNGGSRSQQDERRSRLGESLVLAVCYVAVGALGHLLATVVNVTAVWPPSGIALAALILRGRRIWPGVLLGAFVETTRMFLDTSSPSRTAVTVLVGAFISVGCTLEALVAARLFERTALSPQNVLAHVRGVVWFALLALLSSALGALIGTASLRAGHLISTTHYSQTYVTWLLGDMVGILVWTPVILVFSKEDWRNIRWLEIFIQQLALLAFQGLFLSPILPIPHEHYPLAHLVTPFLVWAGVRLGPQGTALAILNLSTIATWATANGMGPFAYESLDTSLLLVQVFIGNMTVTALLLAAVFQERIRAESALAESRDELERRVDERTAQLAEANRLLTVEVQRRRESEERYRILVEVNPEAVAVLTSDERLKDRRILYANRAAIELVGVQSSAALVGTYSCQWVPPERHEALQGHYRDVAAHGRAGPVEDRLVRADGTIIDVEFTGAMVPSDGNRIILLVMRDITRRKQIEEQRAQLYREAEESIRARDEFIAIASHELKTPLTSLTLQLQGLARKTDKEPALSSRIASALESALRQTTRLNTLVDHLLDISRITQGRLVLDCESVDMVEVVRDVVMRMQQMASRAGCPIQLHEDGSVMGFWDRARLEQVVENLLSNAVKYGCSLPIDVHVRGGPDGKAIFSVRDFGIGIPHADQARIFEQFERAVSVNEFGGFGIGLWISRRIVEAHGGTISVQSSPGAGSTFIVTVPRTCQGCRECRR